MYPFDVMPFTDATGARDGTFFVGSGGADLRRNDCCLHFISAVYTWMFCCNLNIFIVNVYLLSLSVLQENLLKNDVKNDYCSVLSHSLYGKKHISVYSLQKEHTGDTWNCSLAWKKYWTTSRHWMTLMFAKWLRFRLISDLYQFHSKAQRNGIPE